MTFTPKRKPWPEYEHRIRGEFQAMRGVKGKVWWKCVVCFDWIKAGDHYYDGKGAGRVHVTCGHRQGNSE